MNVHKRLLDENLLHSIAVIGGGNEMENLKNQAKELGVEKTFCFRFSKNPWPYVKAADYFVLPSKSESYPLTIGEVMGLHKPIISTNVGGIPEMIDDGKDGILVNFDENEIFEAMKKFLTEPELVKKITEGTESADEKFDENRIYQAPKFLNNNIIY
jgi:glycosyltransferase involved in cell wall biosynthesis